MNYKQPIKTPKVPIAVLSTTFGGKQNNEVFYAQTAEEAQKDIENNYRCKHCQKTIKRQSNKKWIKSYCDETSKDVHLQQLNNLS